MLNETPILRVENLTVRYGAGCPLCQTRRMKNRCEACGSIWAAQDIALSVLETRGIPAQHRVLTSPHDALLAQISVSTRFDLAATLALDGETDVS